MRPREALAVALAILVPGCAAPAAVTSALDDARDWIHDATAPDETDPTPRTSTTPAPTGPAKKGEQTSSDAKRRLEDAPLRLKVEATLEPRHVLNYGAPYYLNISVTNAGGWGGRATAPTTTVRVFQNIGEGATDREVEWARIPVPLNDTRTASYVWYPPPYWGTLVTRVEDSLAKSSIVLEREMHSPRFEVLETDFGRKDCSQGWVEVVINAQNPGELPSRLVTVEGVSVAGQHEGGIRLPPVAGEFVDLEPGEADRVTLRTPMPSPYCEEDDFFITMSYASDDTILVTTGGSIGPLMEDWG